MHFSFPSFKNKAKTASTKKKTVKRNNNNYEHRAGADYYTESGR